MLQQLAYTWETRKIPYQRWLEALENAGQAINERQENELSVRDFNTHGGDEDEADEEEQDNGRAVDAEGVGVEDVLSDTEEADDDNESSEDREDVASIKYSRAFVSTSQEGLSRDLMWPAACAGLRQFL